MKSLLKLTWVELKLFFREPLTMVFTFALPVVFLLVMGGVFGNKPDTTDLHIYRGVGAVNYYNPAYIALVHTAFAFRRHALKALLTTVAILSNINPSLCSSKGRSIATAVKALLVQCTCLDASSGNLANGP